MHMTPTTSHLSCTKTETFQLCNSVTSLYVLCLYVFNSNTPSCVITVINIEKSSASPYVNLYEAVYMYNNAVI